MASASASSLQWNEILVPEKSFPSNHTENDKAESFSIARVIPKPPTSNSFLLLSSPILPSLMEKRKLSFFFLLSVIFSLGLISFLSCIIAETKRAKRRDLKLDGKLCFLPESQAVAYGVAAFVCLSLAELIGNLVLCFNCCSGEKGKTTKSIIPVTLLLFSWICFGFAVILIGVATSMSRVQNYGKGWLDRECYTVKQGIYISSGVLSLVTVFALIGAVVTSKRRQQSDRGRKVHAQNA